MIEVLCCRNSSILCTVWYQYHHHHDPIPFRDENMDMRVLVASLLDLGTCGTYRHLQSSLDGGPGAEDSATHPKANSFLGCCFIVTHLLGNPPKSTLFHAALCQCRQKASPAISFSRSPVLPRQSHTPQPWCPSLSYHTNLAQPTKVKLILPTQPTLLHPSLFFIPSLFSRSPLSLFFSSPLHHHQTHN